MKTGGNYHTSDRVDETTTQAVQSIYQIERHLSGMT